MSELARIDNTSSAMLDIIRRAASDPAVDVTKMEALLNMQERLMAREATQQFNQAFAELQAVLPRITKDGEVRYPINKNEPDGPTKKAFNYAKYESIDELIRPLYLPLGFSFSYDTEPQANGTIIVVGTMLHTGGHQKLAQFGPLPLDTSGGKNNLQAAASTLSYGKRHCLIMLVNLIFEGDDDDGVRGGMEFIGPQDVKQIEDLIAETKSDRNRFLEYMGVAQIENIQKGDKARGVNRLMDKRRQLATAGPLARNDASAARAGPVNIIAPGNGGNSKPAALAKPLAAEEWMTLISAAQTKADLAQFREEYRAALRQLLREDAYGYGEVLDMLAQKEKEL